MWQKFKNKFIGDRAFYRLVLIIAVPVMIQNGITSFVNMLDNLMVGGTYMGNGKFMGFFGSFADPSNFNNYEWQFVVVDVYKKTVEKVDLSPTIPWFAPSIHMDADGKSVLLGHADKKGGAIYRYDIASGKVSKEMDVTTGTAYYIVPMAD